MAKTPVDVSGTMLEPPEGLDPDCLLFLGDPDRKTYGPLTRGWMPVTAAIALGVGSVLSNVASRMPIGAGVHKHVLNTLLGLAIGEGAWRYREKFAAERDIQYYHYMIMHPEDFQAPERKKFSEVLQPWFPVR
ncbi:unnamed protein product [Orchesella dallaii]|uniref:NADH dehydrogenase [ubiquinone] 1 subunit C2 n=1 Tax=Orchesella dallaii TaxID=48710 RepID=A0ABP1PVD7_9HEXA